VRVVLLPRPVLAVRHPAVRAVLVVLVLGPVAVAWWGEDSTAPLRLRALGFLLAAVCALAWDDRSHALTAASPVGLPAVRRGRLLVVLVLSGFAFVAALLAVPDEVDVPLAAALLQSLAMMALLLAVVGAVGRDGDPVLVLPFPALLVSLLVLSHLPHQVALLHADPRSSQWPEERLRWWVLAGAAALLILRAERDPAAR
jgi:hypothetical protein